MMRGDFSSRRPLIPPPFLVLLLLIGGVLVVLVFQNAASNAMFRTSKAPASSFFTAGSAVRSFFDPLLRAGELAEENEELRARVRELEVQSATLQEVREENEALRGALQMELEKEYSLLPSRSVFYSSQGVLVLNKGAREGVKAGMPVITEESVLVGRVENVYQNFSEVILPSHTKSSFDAVTLSEDIHGLVKGEGGTPIFDLVPPESRFERGDVIVTTRQGGIFPAGFLVGRIGRVRKTDVDSFQKGEISLYFSPSHERQVFIIRDFLSLPDPEEENEL